MEQIGFPAEISTRSSKIHGVALAYPMQGHINPMVNLCKRLSSTYGFFISLVNTGLNHRRIIAGAASLQEQGFDIEMVAMPDQVGDSTEYAGGADEAIQKSLIAAEKMEGPFVELIEEFLKKGKRVDFIIADAFLGWVQDAVQRFNIPLVALWCSSAAYAVINYQLPLLNERGYAPIRDKSILEDDKHMITFLEGVPPLHPRDLPSILQVESPTDPGFKKRAERVRKLKEAAWVLVNTYEDLEYGALSAMQRQLGTFSAVGPLVPAGFLGLGGDVRVGTGLWTEDSRCMAFLDKQTPSSVLYVSFGSLAPLTSVELTEIARGIENTKHSFLWVIRPELLKDDFRPFYNEFVERTKDRGLVVEWAPQLQVLFHPSVGGFLSHCGWNSTLESISMGVPIIGMPCVAEQNLNCKHAEVDWKVGIRLRRNKDGIVESGEIERVVARYMKGEEGMELRIRARELREAARTSAMEGGSSLRNLHAFAQAVKKTALKS